MTCARCGKAMAAEVPAKKDSGAKPHKIASAEDLRDRLTRLDTHEARTE